MLFAKNFHTVVAAFVVGAALITGCSTNQVDAAAATPIACEGADGAVDIVRTGLPTYDYNPAESLDVLVDRVDLVVTGTLDSVERVNFDENSRTQVRVSELQIVSSTNDELATSLLEDPVIEIGSAWALRSEPDPIGTQRSFADGMHFVAFLRASELTIGIHPDVQGLHIACGPNAALQAVIERLPADAPSTHTDLVNQLSEPPFHLGDDGLGNCVAISGRVELAKRDFALIGVVESVEVLPVHDLDSGLTERIVGFVEIDRWLSGGDQESVEIEFQRMVEAGDQLLVAGAATPDGYLAWECGFTVTYSAEAEEAWASAFD